MTADPTAGDPWDRWRAATRARIGLGRAGDGLPTAALLDFQLAHARARDAVHGAVDFDALAAAMAPLPVVRVHSRAADRAVYLRRPDLGRRLDEAGCRVLEGMADAQGCDVLFVVADGLSAAAVQAHAAPLIHTCAAGLGGFRLGPVVLAEQARVALGDEAGAILGARLVALLVGERPGLSAADSLGVYLTWNPVVGRVDSERNCISNIHGAGQSIPAAAETLCRLSREALRRGLTGVALKDEGPLLG